MIMCKIQTPIKQYACRSICVLICLKSSTHIPVPPTFSETLLAQITLRVFHSVIAVGQILLIFVLGSHEVSVSLYPIHCIS
jgi:hypothetical protein